MLKEWIRKVTIKRIKKAPANRLNVCVVSLMRCGVSAVGVVLSDVHEGIYGTTINWHYAEEPARVLSAYPKGWHAVYNVNPYLIEFYDKILVIQRDKEVLRKAQLEYGQAQAATIRRPLHPSEIERFHHTFEFLYSQVYDHTFEEDRFFLLRLEHFNRYTERTLEALCEWLEFDIRTYKKHVVIIPVKLVDGVDRDWEVNSCKISASHGIGLTLKQIEVMHNVD